MKIVADAQKLCDYIKELATYKNSKLEVGFMAGTFDMLHAGHRYYIKEAAKHCDFLIVQVHSDEVVKRSKGSDRPIFSRNDRAEAISDMSEVSAVLIDDDKFSTICSKHFNQFRAMRLLKPDVVFIGSDSKLSRFQSLSKKVMKIPLDLDTHTSQIVARVKGLNA